MSDIAFVAAPRICPPGARAKVSILFLYRPLGGIEPYDSHRMIGRFYPGSFRSAREIPWRAWVWFRPVYRLLLVSGSSATEPRRHRDSSGSPCLCAQIEVWSAQAPKATLLAA